MNNIGYIICETATTLTEKINIIEESTGEGGKKRIIAEGIVQTADERNRNGRWYDHTELFPQLTAPRTVELLNAGYLRAENGHPLSKELVRQQTIDGKLCCAQFMKFWTNGMDVWAQFKGTNNELGEEFDSDLRDGCLPAWSLRALGTVENTKRGAEVRNLKLITYDNVIYPSHPGAYTKRVLSESASLEDRLDARGKGLLIPITNDSVLSYIKAESCNFKSIRESFDLLYDDISLVENGSSVQLTDKTGNIIVVNLEAHIHNEIMKYCSLVR